MAVAVADKVTNEVVDEETDARSTYTDNAIWTIIPPKRAEWESTLKTIQTPAIQIPWGTMNKLATTVVSQDTSSPSACTSAMPGINAKQPIYPLHHYPQSEIETYSDWPMMWPHSPQPPLQLHRSSIPEHLTICVMTTPDWSRYRNFVSQ